MFSKADAEAYFNGEKHESLLFMVIGILAIAAAAALYFYIKHSWARGAAIPLVVVGLIQVVVGYTVFSRSDAERQDIVYRMDMNPDALKQEELPRMQKVMKQFVVYRYTEIGLLLAGLILFVLHRSVPEKQWWQGFGLALALLAALMLIADGFAERRGKHYLEGMGRYLEKKY